MLPCEVPYPPCDMKHKKKKDELNGCVQSARQQVNDLFAIAMIYLDVHKDVHHVQSIIIIDGPVVLLS